jgi:putative two-component system response regulator
MDNQSLESQGEILAVDDTPTLLTLLCKLLTGAGYTVRQAPNGELALWTIRKRQPDLVLLDVRMPGMDGLEVCRQIKQDPAIAHVPVIFLSALNELVDKVQGFATGGVDYITKPYQPEEVLARIKTHIALQRYRKMLEAERANLEERVLQRTAELEATAASLRKSKQETENLKNAIIVAMASLAETRSNETGSHIIRTQSYVRALALALVDHSIYSDFLTPTNIDLLYKTAPLHDIGKVGVPDAILLKPGPLEPAEVEIMKRHAKIGGEIIAATGKLLDQSNSFLTLAAEIALCHHEKWDGSGYPRGLKGNAIPISARLMAIADVYDAIISRRIYKKAMPHEDAVEAIREERGYHFDPHMVDVFLSIAEVFQQIALTFKDVDKTPMSEMLAV